MKCPWKLNVPSEYRADDLCDPECAWLVERQKDKRTCRNVYKENRHVMDQCDNGFECSECGNVIEDYEHYGVKGTFNVCPNCGAEVADAD